MLTEEVLWCIHAIDGYWRNTITNRSDTSDDISTTATAHPSH